MFHFRRFVLSLLIVVSLLAASNPMVQAVSPNDPVPIEPLPDGAVLEEVLHQPRAQVAMAFTPDGRLLYTERSGFVSVITGDVPKEDVISFSTVTDGERGLLGIAVDPNFSSNHYVWVYVTHPASGSGGCNGWVNRVVRFTLSDDNVGTNPQIAGCFPVDKFITIHNGGNLHFGPDGKLYVTVGNNNSLNDSSDPSQLLSSPLGKIHRYNPTVPLTIPTDDPFYNTSGAVKSIYAYGLRNSFDFAFDTIGSHQIFATENGDSCDDEINLIKSGYDYGWRPSYPCDDETTPSPTYNTIPPLIYWTPTLAPTGITFYTGNLFPDWKNDLFMCDYKGDLTAIHHFKLNAARTAIVSHTILSDTLNHQPVYCRTDIETGPDSALYYATFLLPPQDNENGPLMRINRTPPFAATSAGVQPAQVQAGELVTYTLHVNHAGTIANTFALTATVSPSATLQVGSIQHQHGTLTHDASHIWWTGSLTPTENWTATYQVQVAAAITASFFVTSSIDFTAPGIAPLHFAPRVIVNGSFIFLPIIRRNS